MKSFALLALFLGLALASSDFQRTDAEVLDNYAFSFRVAMKPQNEETVENLFWEISNPKSPFYANYLTNEQIADLVSLPEEDIQKVENYLTSNAEFCDVYITRGIHRDALYVDTCAAQAKVIFPNLDLAVFQRVDNEHKILRATIEMDVNENLVLLGVPFDIHQYIQGIHGVTDMPVISKRGAQTAPWLSSDKELTVKFMAEYFGMNYDLLTDETINADDGQVRQAVIEFGGAAFGKKELASFQNKYGVPSDPIQKIFGTEETFEESVEASLDVQTITSIGQKLQTWDFVFGANFDFTPVVEKLMSTEGAPKVLSASYGEPETVFGLSKVTDQNNSFRKLGLAGFTFFAAAGDVGPVLDPSDCSKFDAEYPSSSPYIVSVGGTKIIKSSGDEGAWINGSGGFSVYNKRQSFQDEAVEHYLRTASSLPSNPNGSKYNTANRAYPDVSAFGAYEPVLADGSYQPVGGTSGACPQFAGLIATINAYRYQKGLKPLGALNQTLYGLKNGVGKDVVLGMNYATSRFGCSGQLPGFHAAEGWDAATGLGSPRFDTLLEQLS